MARNSQANLFDKDIRALEPKDKMYRKAVGNPKELYVVVYPSGVKTFSLKVNEKYTKIQNFRQGIYSVAEARRDAVAMLRVVESGNEIDKNKYNFGNLASAYIEQKRKMGLDSKYIKLVDSMLGRYIYPTLAHTDIRHIKRSHLLDALNKVFDPNNPKTSRLETIKRLVIYLNGIFDIALQDRYIDYNPAYKLNKEFPSKTKFYAKNNIDSRLAALTSDDDLTRFLLDLKANDKMDSQTKRALYLQILCVNRPINTAGAKWADIDLENGVWQIKAQDMKMKTSHKIALSSYALQILNKQKSEFGVLQSEFVFPTYSKQGHIHRDSLSKAIRTLNGGKYANSATTHGFRATFRTTCSLHKAQLLQMGISDEVIESALAHKTANEVKFAYEREKASLEQLRILMQWYGDYLNNLCEFEI